MKKLIALAALSLCALGAGAQELGQSQTTDSTSTANAGNSGVNTNVYNVSNAAPLSAITSTNRTDFKTNQAYSAATPIAALGTAPCLTQGTAFTAQIVGGGLGYSGKGTKDTDCRADANVNLIRNIEAARAVMTVKAADGTIGMLPQDPDLYIALKAVACNVTAVADAYEQTSRPCAEPVLYENRAKRTRQ